MTEVTPSQLRFVRAVLRSGSTISEVDDPVSAEIVERMLEVGVGRDTSMWERREQEALASVEGKVRTPQTPATGQEKEWVQLMFTMRAYNELGDLAARFCAKTEAYRNYADRNVLLHYFKADRPLPRYWIPLLKDFCEYYGI